MNKESLDAAKRFHEELGKMIENESANNQVKKESVPSIATDESEAQIKRKRKEREGLWFEAMNNFATDVKHKLQFLCSQFQEILETPFDEPAECTLARVEVEIDGCKHQVLGRLLNKFCISEDNFCAIEYLLWGLKKQADELSETFWARPF